jgi:alcohol dehydrogenase (cytochrome c)
MRAANRFLPITLIMITTRLLAADKVLDLRFENPADWLSYDRDNTSQRYSRLNQINIGNVARLQAKWVFQTIRIPTRSEATPLVRSGIMYFTVGGAEAFALDARTGRVIWDFNYRYPDPPETQSGAPSNGPVVGANYNRGVALMGNRVFMATGDCSLIALDSRSGSLIWRTAVREPEPCFGITAAPVVFGNRVLIGVRGGDAGELRGYVDAYDAETGKRAWRFYSIPAPGEPGSETWPASDVWKTGGGPTWTSGSFDANLNLLYWTTGNAGPKDFDWTDRPGDNLYTSSVIAFNHSTLKLVCNYQFTPHDKWDWDAN